MLCLIEGETEWVNQDTTILFHLFQAWCEGSVLAGLRVVSSMNSTLFFALKGSGK